jgi:LPS-assembly protein
MTSPVARSAVPAPPPAQEPSAKSANPGSPKAPTKERKPGVNDGAIDIHSDHATLGVDGNATLKGNVIVRQGDREIHADEIEYNSKTNAFKTDSSLEYEDPLVKITGNGGDYSPTQGADFRAATFDLQQRPARGSADAMKLTPQGVLDLKGVRFTTCPKIEESWQIRAKSVTLDTGAQVGEARSAIVNFEGVPILYLPWLSFPLSNQRKSGFLYPTIGSNSRSGASVSIPYYWNIAPNADMTFEPIEYSRRGIDLGGELRYLNTGEHGALTWNFLPHDSVYGAGRSRRGTCASPSTPRISATRTTSRTLRRVRRGPAPPSSNSRRNWPIATSTGISMARFSTTAPSITLCPKLTDRGPACPVWPPARISAGVRPSNCDTASNRRSSTFTARSPGSSRTASA